MGSVLEMVRFSLLILFIYDLYVFG